MIYLDHAATSPLRPEAREAMAAWWDVPANPSSAHRFGQAAAAALDAARARVAAHVGVDPRRVVFTSGATEAAHLVLHGLRARRPGPVVVGGGEHPCVRDAAGDAVATWGLGADGRVVVAPIDAETAAVAVQLANHETGVLQPVAEAHAVAAAAGVPLVLDAVHALGRVDLADVVAEAWILAAHKVGGPVGVGAAVVPDADAFPPLFDGPQERGRRGGTVPVALAVGFAAALDAAAGERARAVAVAEARRDRIEAACVAAGARIVGSGVPRVATTTAAVFDGLPGDVLVQALDLEGIAVSAGAACASGSLEASPTLEAMGDPSPRSLVRLSQGWSTDDDDVDAVVARLPVVVDRVRAAFAHTASDAPR